MTVTRAILGVAAIPRWPLTREITSLDLEPSAHWAELTSPDDGPDRVDPLQTDAFVEANRDPERATVADRTVLDRVR